MLISCSSSDTCNEQKADSADIFIMLLGYLLMHLTFINLFINMRKLGSKFWLGRFTYPEDAQWELD